MDREVFMGKMELDKVFSKQSAEDYIRNRQVVYYLSMPILLFYLENKRKGPSLITEMNGFIEAIEKGFEHNIVPIDMSLESIIEAIDDEWYICHNVSKHLNPFFLSTFTSLLYDVNRWWECEGLEAFINQCFAE